MHPIFTRFNSSVILIVLGAIGLATPATAAPRVYRETIVPRWFGDTNRFWYRLNLPGDKREFILVDAEKGMRVPAFDHARVAKALAAKSNEAVDAEKLPINALTFAADGKSVQLKGDDGIWQCDLTTYELTKVNSDKTEPDETPETPGGRGRRGRPRSRSGVSLKSPDGNWEAFVREHNLFLRDLKNDKEHRLTDDATATNSYARNAQRDRAVEMEYETREAETPVPEIYWSPDSRHLTAMRTTAGKERTVYMVESSPRDQLQPKLQSYPYLKPGDEVPVRKPHLFDVEKLKEVAVDDALFEEPWSISDLRWPTNSSEFTFLFNERGHQVLRILGVNAANGAVRKVIDEQSKTFVNYSGKYFCEYLQENNEIIWMSERDGWSHLYLYDTSKGVVKNQITRGEWVVRDVDRVDKERRQIWFRAGGIRPGQNPYYVHYCRVNFDGTGLVVLTEGDGTHTVQFSPHRRFIIDTWSRVDKAPVHELRRSDDGKLICLLEECDTTELDESGWRPPERFRAKGRDGETDIYGIIHWPRELEPARKYPVLESIYAGPQGSFVPTGFRSSYGQDEFTRRGFIVVQIDGMGTANRSKKFHDVCWKNLADAGFPDRILWMKAAAAKYPALDLTRVGVYGGSAGGQNALGAMLFHGDFYKAAAADCGCHDNRMDKVWWNEQWMGWPLGPHYDEQSNVTQAHRLQGKLLLTVGELDRNVDPASTMQVVNALIKADKDFELIVFPGGGHGAGGSPYGQRRRLDFFVRHLMNAGAETTTQPRTTSSATEQKRPGA